MTNQHVVGGCSTYSKTQHLHLPHYPQQIDWAAGYEVWWNEESWIDFTAALGAIFLGYGAVDRAINNQLSYSGVLMPLSHPLEEETAALFCSLTGWDQVRWCKNGSDATEAAVRLARHKTARKVIITNSYHGFHSDLVTATSGKSGGVLRGSIEYLAAIGDTNQLIDLIKRGIAAAVLVEPLTADGQEWDWHAVKDACEKTGTLLIFDEIITGFRVRLGSAVDVRPDLACYGKAIANGMPLACVAGPRPLMKAFEKEVFFSGTYAGESLSLAACRATLQQLRDHPPYKRLREYHLRLLTALGRCTGYPGRLHIDLPECDHQDLVNILAHEGILVGRDFFLMDAHDEIAIQSAEDALQIARGELGI